MFCPIGDAQMIIQKMKVLNEILDFIKNYEKIGICFLRVNDSFFTCTEMGFRKQLHINKEDKHYTITESSIDSTYVSTIEIRFKVEDKIKEYDGLDDSYFCLAESRDIVNWFKGINLEDISELRDRLNSGKFSFMEKRYV